MREWRTIFKLRCDKHAQWEIRQGMGFCLGILKSKCPSVFQDFE
jgi:thymidylate synthase ThyX